MWKKESNSKNALYINICASGTSNDEIHKDVRAEINEHKKMTALYSKSDATAVNKRKYAHIAFKKCEMHDAIDLLNESLCFAEKKSPNMGIAYADRSTCFFNLKMYDKCLVDIDLALKFNCPRHLRPALEQLKADCYKCIADGAQLKENHLSLDFPEKEGYPGWSEAFDIQKGSNGQISVVATQNIGIGQIVAIDKAFTKTLFMIYGWRCNICLRRLTNLVPCKKCTTAMFCVECVDNNLHRYECGMKTSLWSQYNNNLMLELRTFFVAMNLFATADEMMDFVEKCLAAECNELPHPFDEPRSRYRAFLLLHNQPAVAHEEFGQIVNCTYRILLDIPKVSVMFDTKRHRRFLMHLVGHHFIMNEQQKYFTKVRFENACGVENTRNCYAQVGLLMRYMNHYCSPNIFPVDVNGDTVYVAVKPIQTGERLRVSYLSFHWEFESNWKMKTLGYSCDCERCRNEHPSPAEVKQLRNEDYYSSIDSYRYCDTDEYESLNHTEIQMMKIRCSNLLKKYGRMKWCKEFGNVLLVYTELLKVEFNRSHIESHPKLQPDDCLNNNFGAICC